MELYLGFLLLAQAFYLASFQHSTDSPGRTIDKSWLRELVKNKTGSQDAAVPGGNTEFNQGADVALESTRDYSSGIASGSMAILPEQEENVTGQDKNANEGSDDLNSVTATQPAVDLNATTEQPHFPEANVSASAAMDSSNASQIDTTDAKEGFINSNATQNSSTHLAAENSTSFLDLDSNHTDSQTTLAPEGNDTQESTIKPDEDTWLTNTTESTDTTNETSSTSLSTRFHSTTTDISPETTITPLQNTPELANKTGKGSATGSDSDRGTVAVYGVISCRKMVMCDVIACEIFENITLG